MDHRPARCPLMTADPQSSSQSSHIHWSRAEHVARGTIPPTSSFARLRMRIGDGAPAALRLLGSTRRLSENERPSLHKKGPRCLACACRSGVQVCASKTGWKERPSNRMRQGGHRETQNPGDLNSATDSMIQMVSDAAQSRHYKKGHDANSLESGDILQHSQNSAAAMLLVANAFRADPKPIYEASTAPISVVPGGIGAAAPCAAQN